MQYSIINLYKHLPVASRIFLQLRMRIAPFDELMSHIPSKGKILEVGCGYGILSWAIHLTRPYCTVIGIDIDSDRILHAQKTVQKEKNISFLVCDITKESLPKAEYASIVLFDVLHHVDKLSQEKIIIQSHKLLKQGGSILLKEINTTPLWKYWWNILHDTIVTKGERIYCRSHTEWRTILEKHGFSVSQPTFSQKGLLYPHVLIVGTKKEN